MNGYVSSLLDVFNAGKGNTKFAIYSLSTNLSTAMIGVRRKQRHCFLLTGGACKLSRPTIIQTKRNQAQIYLESVEAASLHFCSVSCMKLSTVIGSSATNGQSWVVAMELRTASILFSRMSRALVDRYSKLRKTSPTLRRSEIYNSQLEYIIIKTINSFNSTCTGSQNINKNWRINNTEKLKRSSSFILLNLMIGWSPSRFPWHCVSFIISDYRAMHGGAIERKRRIA